MVLGFGELVAGWFLLHRFPRRPSDGLGRLRSRQAQVEEEGAASWAAGPSDRRLLGRTVPSASWAEPLGSRAAR